MKISRHVDTSILILEQPPPCFYQVRGIWWLLAIWPISPSPWCSRCTLSLSRILPVIKANRMFQLCQVPSLSTHFNKHHTGSVSPPHPPSAYWKTTNHPYTLQMLVSTIGDSQKFDTYKLRWSIWQIPSAMAEPQSECCDGQNKCFVWILTGNSLDLQTNILLYNMYSTVPLYSTVVSRCKLNNPRNFVIILRRKFSQGSTFLLLVSRLSVFC